MNIVTRWIAWCDDGAYVAALYGALESEAKMRECLANAATHGYEVKHLRPVRIEIDLDSSSKARGNLQ